MGKIWIDATYFIKWTRPPVGIIRVEYELIQWAIENLEQVGFFEYDAGGRRFIPIETKLILSRLSRSYVVENNVFSQKTGFFQPRFKDIQLSSKEILRACYKFALSFVNPEYHFPISSFLKKNISKIRKRNPFKRHIIPENKIKAVDKNHPFSENDSVLCAGMTWNYSTIQDDIKLIKNSIKLSYYGFCYDLIPVKFPNFCIIKAGTFSPYFVKLSEAIDCMFCISKSTEHDYKEFITEHKIPCPPTVVVKLGNVIYSAETKISNELKQLMKNEYILFVSTIEGRKNHQCLYKALLYLLENGYKNLPKFIFVGMPGWGVSDLINDINLDPRVKDYIQILSEISDADLNALYKNALFTLYPSFYEGWGLPVAESLSYGKMAIVSSTSSLPEVGGDLVDYVNPYDTIGWANRIAFYLTDREELAKREKKIREQYQKSSWQDFSIQVFNKIMKSGDDRDNKR